MQFQRASKAAHHIIGVALLALLLAQWGALLHAVDHGPVHGAAAVQRAATGAPVNAAAHQPLDEHEVPGAQVDNGEHSAGSPVCQLYDHLLLAQASGCAAPQVPGRKWCTTAPSWALRAALPLGALQAYEARGPPRA